MMNYIGIDGNVHSDELKHWKYIKKIKSGNGWRYFYTPEELKEYQDGKIEIKEKKIPDKKIPDKKIPDKKIPDKIIKDKKIPDKIIKDKTFRYSPQDAYREEKRSEEEEAKERAKERRKQDLKRKLEYAKPQKPSTMLERARHDRDREQERWLKTREHILEQNRRANKDPEPFRPQRTLARNDVRFRENEEIHKKRRAVNHDRVSRALEYQVKTKKALSTVKKSKSAVSKGKSKAEKIIKSEAAGTKRVLNATRGKGNNFYSGDGKTYSKYNKKKQRFGKKKYKTSKMERAILKGYRVTHPYE